MRKSNPTGREGPYSSIIAVEGDHLVCQSSKESDAYVHCQSSKELFIAIPYSQQGTTVDIRVRCVLWTVAKDLFFSL